MFWLLVLQLLLHPHMRDHSTRRRTRFWLLVLQLLLLKHLLFQDLLRTCSRRHSRMGDH